MDRNGDRSGNHARGAKSEHNDRKRPARRLPSMLTWLAIAGLAAGTFAFFHEAEKSILMPG
jgi:hypothetical protein